MIIFPNQRQLIMICILLFSAIEYVSVDKRSVIGNVSMAVGLSAAGAAEAWVLKDSAESILKF